MLSLRYAIRQVPIELVSSMQALQTFQDEEGVTQFKVCFSNEEVPAIPIIIKRNTLLFQALESIPAEKEDGSRRKSEPSHAVIADFLDDLAVVIWPPRVDKMTFMDRKNAASLSGAELRKEMFMNGFDIGKTHMVPLLAGAGMSRSGKYLFIREGLRGEALRRITLGLVDADRKKEPSPDQTGTQTDRKIKANKVTVLNLHETCAGKKDRPENVTVNPAKLLAYIGLADTDGVSLAELGAIWKKRNPPVKVSPQAPAATPQTNPAECIQIDSDSVVVVKDVYKPLKINALGGYVICNNTDTGEVSLRVLDDNENACLTDGYGFICPEWSQEINRLRRCRESGTRDAEAGGFTNRAFIIRLPFVKGAVIECDYVRYLKELGVTQITDMWGMAHPLDGVKMILTESMFKGAKLFPHLKGRKEGQSVWAHYCKKLKESGLSMILAGSDSAPTGKTSLNYQFLSSMQPDVESLEQLTAWEHAQQDTRLGLLKGPTRDKDGNSTEEEIREFAERMIRQLEESVRVDAEQQTEQAQEDAIADADDADNAPDPSAQSEAAPETDAPDDAESAAAKRNGDASYAGLLARLLRKYPRAAFTRTVMEEFATVTVKAAADASQGRIRVEGDVRILCGDPFILLNGIAEREGKLTPDLKHALLQSSGMVYAPGLEKDELLLLRNPHVSAFEAIVAKNLDTSRQDEDADCIPREYYQTYFGQHNGIIFINSAVASTLGGADFDGDRAKVIFEPYAITLVNSNTKKINKLLKASKDASFRLNEDANIEGKALPIVSIQGFPANNLTVADMNRAYWDKVYKTYLDSIESKVGLYSVNGATLAFNHGMVAAADPSDETQLTQAVAFLKTMARLTTVIGLDIDAAKSGTHPKAPSYGKMGRMSALLRFSRSYEKTSPGEAALNRYKKAYNAATWTPDGSESPDKSDAANSNADSATDEVVNSQRQSYHTLSGSVAASELVESFKLDTHYDDLQRWLPTARDRKCQKEEVAFIDVLCEGLDTAPDAAMSAALDELKAITEKVNASRSASGRIAQATGWILQRRVDILRHLLCYYPLEMALLLDERIVKGAEDKVAKIKLDSDSALIKLAFCTNETRREELKETVFGKQEDEGFIYDVTALQLAKHVQRLRNALASKKELLNKNGSGSKTRTPVPVSYAKQCSDIKDIAAKHQVDCWELGLWMMKRGIIKEKDFVLLFVADMKDSAGKEVESHVQPHQ